MVSLTTLVFIFIFVLGLCIGSFLNVLIYRLPRSLPLTGRSFCPRCKKKISWYDNIPLFSFLFLGGKCRSCHSPISWQYPLVELVTGGLFVLTTGFVIRDTQYVISWQNLIPITYYLLLISALIVIFVIDLKHEIILDQIVFPAILFTFFFLIINHQPLIINHFFTAFLAASFFLLLHLVTRSRGMGLGDVKLAFLIGLVLGFPKTIVSFYLAFLTGAFIGVILILAGKKRFGQPIPFGPFLIMGTIIALFWGQMILKWTTARFF